MYQPHQKLKTPDDSKVIWRYFDLSGFMRLISTGKLYFRRCDKFDDKWDSCYLPSTLVLQNKATDDDVRKIRRVLQVQERLRSEYFANCWHRNADESAAMWELYAARNHGIALRTTVGRLKECFRSCSHNVFIGKVEYGPFEQPGLVDWSNVLTPSFVKRTEYEYEQEVRALIWSGRQPTQFRPDETYIESDDVGFACPIDIPKLIESVVLSPISSFDFDKMIRSILDKFGFSQIPTQSSRLAESPPSLSVYDKHEPKVFTLSLRMEKKEVETLLKACHDFCDAANLKDSGLWITVNDAAHRAGYGGDRGSLE